MRDINSSAVMVGCLYLNCQGLFSAPVQSRLHPFALCCVPADRLHVKLWQHHLRCSPSLLSVAISFIHTPVPACVSTAGLSLDANVSETFAQCLHRASTVTL